MGAPQVVLDNRRGAGMTIGIDLAGELFTGLTGTQMEHIACKGTGTVLVDLIARRVH